MDLSDDIKTLKGIGDKTAVLFSRLGVSNKEQLLRLYPRAYDRLEKIKKVTFLEDGMQAILRLKVLSFPKERRGGRIPVTVFEAGDDTGSMDLVFFHSPYIKSVLKKNTIHLFRGKVVKKGNRFVMDQPVILKETDYERQKDCLLPVYPLTKGLTQNLVRKSVKTVLEQKVSFEYLPDALRKKEGLIEEEKALIDIHFPKDESCLLAAHNRLVFDEFFQFMLAVRSLKESTQERKNIFPMLETADTSRLIEALPFSLTEDQKKVWFEICGDLCGPYTMNRLVQGDVGSGKTILAILALLLAISNGYQGAMMAPTEVLAVQHFEGISELTQKFHLPFQPVLLTGSLTAKQKKEAYETIKTGEANLIIGTHALIQEKVEYSKLSLVITDEQHRFGVRQRETFMVKGGSPHVLVMSATPIPRTLAMIFYGDLQVSTVKSMPENRLPIKNCVISGGDRGKAYRFMEKEIAEGRQIYVICPMIEENEELELENVMDYGKKLRDIFPASIRIEILHGKMKPVEKNRIMQAFSRKNIDILVSTTVIEVGINVPNATVMMVENAERFGLAQLHQLRGRVGRGKYQSYCIFINASDSDVAKERLEILNHSNDGFEIASKDLKLRGPGDLFGYRQSGEMQFQLADVFQDSKILMQASHVVSSLTKEERKIYLKHVDFPSI